MKYKTKIKKPMVRVARKTVTIHCVGGGSLAGQEWGALWEVKSPPRERVTGEQAPVLAAQVG